MERKVGQHTLVDPRVKRKGHDEVDIKPSIEPDFAERNFANDT